MSLEETATLSNDRNSIIEGTNKQLELMLCAPMTAVAFGYFDIQDDFVFIGSHNSYQCYRSLSKALQVSAMLVMPVRSIARAPSSSFYESRLTALLAS